MAKPQLPAHVIDIDPAGDVIAICFGLVKKKIGMEAGAEPCTDVVESECRMRVSSKILSVASAPFKAMLQPGFCEGNFQRSTESPLELNLEDNSFALELLLKIIHHHDVSTVFFSIPAEDGEIMSDHDYSALYELALLAEKYLCRHVVRYFCGSWITKLALKARHFEQFERLTEVAFRVRNPEKFFEATGYLLRHKQEFDTIKSQYLRRLLQKTKLRENQIRLEAAFVMQNGLFELAEYYAKHDLEEMEDGCNRAYRIEQQISLIRKIHKDVQEPDALGKPHNYQEAFGRIIVDTPLRCDGWCRLGLVRKNLIRTDEFRAEIPRGVTLEDFLQESRGEWD